MASRVVVRMLDRFGRAFKQMQAPRWPGGQRVRGAVHLLQGSLAGIVKGTETQVAAGFVRYVGWRFVIGRIGARCVSSKRRLPCSGRFATRLRRTNENAETVRWYGRVVHT